MRGLVVTSDGRPRPGVLVSDGRTVTVTGADGTFSVDPAGPFVFLTRPAGYTADRWFAPSAVAQVTFTLTPAPVPFPYRFVHVSDLHVTDPVLNRLAYPQPVEMGSADALSEFLAAVPDRAGAVSSVIATGDLTDFGSDGEFGALRKAVATSPLPVHLLPGNHDHLAGKPVSDSAITRTGYEIHTGDPSGYERNLGPRWYSFDLPGLHVVAMDWHTHELGLDHELQDGWIRADLESLPPGTPWILLSHDQPWHSILDGLPRKPLATFSGHRHVSRVVRVDGILHVNTPTPLFGSLDYAPPSFRVVTWDGDRISLHTRAVAPAGLERSTFEAPAISRRHAARDEPVVRWHHQLTGAGHRAPARVHGDSVIVGVKHEDSPAGGVELLSRADGARRWLSALRSSVKGTPAVFADSVVVTEVSGDTVSLDRADGTERWRAPSPDPLRLFAWTDPVVAGGLVVVGDLSRLRALDAATGSLRWERQDLAPYQTLAGHAAPVVADDVLFVGSHPLPCGMVALDLRTGATRLAPCDKAANWPSPGETPIGTPLYDTVSAALYLPAPGAVGRVDAATGTLMWSAATSRPFSPATPVSTPWGIAITDGGQAVVLLNRDNGSVLWRTEPNGTGPFALTSYTRTPHPLFASPVLLGDTLAAPGLDGVLRVLDARTGRMLREVPLGVPVAAPLTVDGDLAVAVAVDGTVLGLDAGSLAHGHQ